MAPNLLWLVVLAMVIGCTFDRIDPHTPGDRCLYSCPEGMVCSGTTFGRSRANPGRCQLTPHRCMVVGDCRPREKCIRPTEGVGLCIGLPIPRMSGAAPLVLRESIGGCSVLSRILML